MHALRIILCPTQKILTLKLDMETLVYDVVQDLYLRINKNVSVPVEDFGLFVPDPDPSRAYWLDNSKPVCYYPLMDKNIMLEFKSRIRRLVIRTMDETKKTLAVDDSKTIAELLLPICNKMGISNHEEYSLIREIDEEERMKNMTLKKGKNQIRDFEKMEKMKQKLKTDDELNWLPHSKTLRQLGVAETDELLLRRKYFFSDQNVDARDPIQLNLLYVQLRDAIIQGAHPVNIEEAIQLAGIQCQAEMGNCTNDKQKLLHSNLKDYLPKEYVKTKGVEKKIWQHYEKLNGTLDKDAKVQYAQLCRSLKTYGITFFLVKEKLRAKNKLVPRLLGISKEYVMRVDEKTKEMIQQWPLTTVRRYAATASLFSLDFGDYSTENYVIQTLEGEKIAQLIAGYIDIILKKQKVKDQLDDDADEETAMIEENIAPSKANLISHNEVDVNKRRFQQHSIATIGQVAVPASRGSNNISQGYIGGPQSIRSDGKIGMGHANVPPAQKFQIRDLSQPKRALMVRIGENLKILQAATEDLDKHMQVAKLGNDDSARTYRKQTLDVAKNKIKGNLMLMTMATGNILSMVQYENESDDGNCDDYGRIDTAVTTIGYNTERLLENVKKVYEVAYESPEEGTFVPDLVGAAKNLLSAFQDLLNASKPFKNESDKDLANEMEEEFKPFSDKNLLEAVNRVGEGSRALLQLITAAEKNSVLQEEWELRDNLLTDAKQVAASISSLVKMVKEASVAVKEASGPEAQSALIQAAKKLGEATSMLISAAKVVACSAEQPLSQQQLQASARQVNSSMDNMMVLVEPIRTEPLHGKMENLTNDITVKIDRMLEHVAENTIAAHQDQMVLRFLLASERLPNVVGNRVEMVEQARILAETGSQLVSCLDQSSAGVGTSGRGGASANQSTTSLDSDKQRRLMIASQALADAVERLVQASKMCHSTTPTEEEQQELVQAAQHMISVAHVTAGEIIRHRLTKGLEFAGRQASMAADQLVVTSQEAVRSVRTSDYQLLSESQEMTDIILPNMVTICSKIRDNPTDSNTQTNLLDACQSLIKSLEQLLKSSEALGPRVQDPSLQSALNITVQTSGSSLAGLKESVQCAEKILRPTKAANIGSLEDGQLQMLHSLLDSAAESVARGELYPLPGETIETVSSIIGNCSRTANKTLDNLYDDMAALQIHFNNKTDSSAVQSDLFKSAGKLMESMEKLLHGARGIAALIPKNESPDKMYESQIELIDFGHQIIRSGEDVIQTLKLGSVGAVNLAEVKKSINQMQTDINSLVTKIPSYRKIDDLVLKLNSTMMKFENDCKSKQFPKPDTVTPGKSYNQLQSEFTASVAIFNQTLNDLINNNGTYATISNLVDQLQDSHGLMLDAGSLLVAQSPSNEAELAMGLKSVSNESANLLDQLKLVLSYSSTPDVNLLKQSLLKAAGDVSESMNELLSSCATTLPRTQQLCESSQRQMDALKTSLLSEPPSLPLNNDSYSDSIDKINKEYEILLKEMGQLPKTCKNNAEDDFCNSVRNVANATTNMLNAATQANYRLGVIHSSTLNKEPELAVTESIMNGEESTESLLKKFQNHSDIIKSNCFELSSDDNSEMKCRELANDVRKRAGSICQLLKDVIQRNESKSNQNQLLKTGKVVAESVADLIRTIGAGPRSLAKANANPGEPDSWIVGCDKVRNSVEQLVAEMTAILTSSDSDVLTDDDSSSNLSAESITQEGRAAQQHIHRASIDMIEGTNSLFRAASVLARDPTSIPANQAYIINQRTCNTAIRKLKDTVQYYAPGQQEFMEMEEEIKHLLRNLQPRVIGSMSVNTTTELQRAKSSLKQLLTNISGPEHLLRQKNKKLEYIGKALCRSERYLAPLVDSVSILSASLPHSRDKAEIIELTRTVLEAFLETIETGQKLLESEDTKPVLESIGSLKEGGNDLMNFVDGIITSYGTVEGYVGCLQKSMDKLTSNDIDLMASIGGKDMAALGHTRIVQSVKSITDALNKFGGETNVTAGSGGVSGLVGGTRLQKKESMKRGRDINEEVLKGHKGDAETTQSGSRKKLIQEYDQLVTGVLQVVNSGVDNAEKLKKTALNIGQASVDLMRYEQHESGSSSWTALLRGRLTDILVALQSNAKATQACISAVDNVTQLTTDLDTAILFASSGTLTLSATDDIGDNNFMVGSVGAIRDDMNKITKSMKDELQRVVELSESDEHQDKLILAIDASMMQIKEMCTSVKRSAIAIGAKPELIGLTDGSEEISHAQTSLLNAVRDVNVSLIDFLNSIKNKGNDAKDDQKIKVEQSKEVTFSKLKDLNKSIKSLADSGMRGTRALESAVDAMQNELNKLETWSPEQGFDELLGEQGEAAIASLTEHQVPLMEEEAMYTAENLVLMTRPLVTAGQKSMTALQTFRQEDIMIAANFGRKAIQDFARHLRMTVSLTLNDKTDSKRMFNGDGNKQPSGLSSDFNQDKGETARKMVDQGKGAVKSLIDMYENLTRSVSNNGVGKDSAKMQMTLASRRVTHAIYEVNQCATSLIKESDYIDTSDPVALAEEELMDAAKQIEAAAKKLSMLRPRKSEKEEDGEETIDDQLLAGCKSIVSATKLLLETASTAQQELVREGRVNPQSAAAGVGSAQWSRGLVSAARLVAAATDNLCGSARAVVHGEPGGMERLVSASRQVASGTAHLLYACQVRSAGLDSSGNRGLQAAGAAVRKATETLVREATSAAAAASQGGGTTTQSSVGGPSTSIVSSMRNVIQAQADIVAKEKELEMLRSKYNTIRQEHITTHPDYFQDDN